MRLAVDEGKTMPQVARDLDLSHSALQTWVERARADRTDGQDGPHTPEREELASCSADPQGHGRNGQDLGFRVSIGDARCALHPRDASVLRGVMGPLTPREAGGRLAP